MLVKDVPSSPLRPKSTWSNLVPFILAACAMHKAGKTVKMQGNLSETVQPRVVTLAYLVPLVVYAGSFAFHATLT